MKKVRNGVCSRCNATHERTHSQYCLACHAANMREWRKTHRLTPEQRIKDNCRSQSSMLKRRGKLIQEPCAVCGSEDSQMHHDDYTKPRDVTWLCRPCHLRHHEQEAHGRGIEQTGRGHSLYFS